MRLHSWTDAAGACGYYRIRAPWAELARHGHETVIPTNPPAVPTMGDVLDADLMVAQRITNAAGLPEWTHRRALCPVVYELDDDIWSLDLENPPLGTYMNPQWGDHVGEFIAQSDLVTVSTGPLAERVSRWNPNVIVLPNRIDAAALVLPAPERTDGRVTVGWTCSTSHLTDLRSVAEPWREFFTSRPDVELHVIGVDYRYELCLPDVRYRPWRVDLMDYYAGLDFDIGLAPLAPLRFNISKSPIKCVEYFARGIPVIASDIGPYRDFVEDGTTGFLVRTSEEWVERLGELVDDPAMRAEMGANARKVAERWTVQEHWPAWEAAYRSVLR